jgi:hypothetical protein
VQPSLRRTHLYGNLPYNNVIVGSNRCWRFFIKFSLCFLFTTLKVE